MKSSCHHGTWFGRRTFSSNVNSPVCCKYTQLRLSHLEWTSTTDNSGIFFSVHKTGARFSESQPIKTFLPNSLDKRGSESDPFVQTVFQKLLPLPYWNSGRSNAMLSFLVARRRLDDVSEFEFRKYSVTVSESGLQWKIYRGLICLPVTCVAPLSCFRVLLFLLIANMPKTAFLFAIKAKELLKLFLDNRGQGTWSFVRSGSTAGSWFRSSWRRRTKRCIGSGWWPATAA